MSSRKANFPLFYALASLVLIIACLYWAKPVLIPVALAVLLTFLLNPIGQRTPQSMVSADACRSGGGRAGGLAGGRRRLDGHASTQQPHV